MHDASVQQRFIELRTKGWSFARIARELGVSKPTLITWSRKFQLQIQNLRAVELEALAEEFVSNTEARVRQLGQQLRQVEGELVNRKLSDLSTARLFTLAAALRRQILEAAGPTRFAATTKELEKDEVWEQAVDWEA